MAEIISTVIGGRDRNDRDGLDGAGVKAVGVARVPPLGLDTGHGAGGLRCITATPPRWDSIHEPCDGIRARID